jgi:chromosome segregation ATPase
MRQISFVIFAVWLLLPAVGVAQQQGRHGSGANRGTASNAPPEDSDTATFTRAVADQATEDQVAQFTAMTKSTETAQQQAGAIERLGATADHSEELISKAATLQSSVDQALSDTSKFRQSFSKSQQATFKAPAKKLAKSDAGATKDAKALAHQLEEVPPNVERVKAAISHLEKALQELQSDQRELGKAMAIVSH